HGTQQRISLNGAILHEPRRLGLELIEGLPKPINGKKVAVGVGGFWVMTPLVLDGGAAVIVNRGFVPQGRATPELRGEASMPPGPLTITGLLRAPEVRVPFAPGNDPDNDAWYLRDPTDIALARGLERSAPFTVDAFAAHTPPGGLPQAGETRIAIRNNHLQYALTWYALAAVLLLMSGLWLRQEIARNRRSLDAAIDDDA
ncbi:MAG: SURF1 family cytochrome oxidase biogenesis protein, partial [Pseudomonadota bacterium]